jgi:Ca2+-transporting ATPase
MRRAPRPPQESLFAHGIWQHILWVGALITALCLVVQAWSLRVGDAHGQTMVFTVLTLAQMAHVLAIRSETESLFTRGITTNLPLLGAVLVTTALQLAIVYVPALNSIFHTQPLEAGELGVCVVLASTVFFAVEIEKALVRRGWLYR